MVEEHSGYDVLGEIKINGASGTAGEALMSGGAAALPTFGAPAPAAHGAAQHTDVTRELFLPANEGYVSAGTPGGKGYYAVVNGAANSDEPTVYFTHKVPTDFVSFTSVEAIWTCGAAAGDMHWLMYGIYSACGEALGIHIEEPAAGETATGGTDIKNCQEAPNRLTMANLALGDTFGIYFNRIGSNPADTLNATVSLYGLLFTYVGHQ